MKFDEIIPRGRQPDRPFHIFRTPQNPMHNILKLHKIRRLDLLISKIVKRPVGKDADVFLAIRVILYIWHLAFSRIIGEICMCLESFKFVRDFFDRKGRILVFPPPVTNLRKGVFWRLVQHNASSFLWSGATQFQQGNDYPTDPFPIF